MRFKKFTIKKIALFTLVFVFVSLVATACQTPAPEPEQVVVTVEVEGEEGETVVVTATPDPDAMEEEEEEEAEESTLERVRREGVVRVGFANENPYAFAKPDGTLSGEAVEVARTVFERLGIPEMEGVLTNFGSLIPGLQAERFDVITAGMYITPTRCQEVIFADPEYTIGEALLVPAGNPDDLHSYQDIADNPDIKVGTGAGYLEYDYMTAIGVSEDQIVTFPDDPSGLAGLRAGQIDAWTGTAPTLAKLIQTNDVTNFELADPFEQPVIDGSSVAGYGAAAFRYEDLDFRNAFNEELAKLKEEGQLVEIIGQFEGFGAQTLPGDTRAQDLCPDSYEDLDLAP